MALKAKIPGIQSSHVLSRFPVTSLRATSVLHWDLGAVFMSRCKGISFGCHLINFLKIQGVFCFYLRMIDVA